MRELTLRLWCLETALARHPGDDDTALGLAGRLAAFLGGSPSPLVGEGRGEGVAPPEPAPAPAAPPPHPAAARPPSPTRGEGEPAPAAETPSTADDQAARRVVWALERAGGSGRGGEIRAATGLAPYPWQKAVNALIAAGRLRAEGATRNRVYSLVPAGGRAAEPPRTAAAIPAAAPPPDPGSPLAREAAEYLRGKGLEVGRAASHWIIRDRELTDADLIARANRKRALAGEPPFDAGVSPVFGGPS